MLKVGVSLLRVRSELSGLIKTKMRTPVSLCESAAYRYACDGECLSFGVTLFADDSACFLTTYIEHIVGLFPISTLQLVCA